MINFDNYLTTTIENYGTLESLYESEKNTNTDKLVGILFDKFSSLLNNILDTIKEELITSISDNPLETVDQFMYLLYQHIATINNWTVISDSALFYRQIIDAFYGDSAELKPEDMPQLFQRLRHGSFMMLNTEADLGIRRLTSIYLEPMNAYEELINTYLTVRLSNQVSKDVSSLLNELQQIISGINTKEYKSYDEVKQAMQAVDLEPSTNTEASDLVSAKVFRIIEMSAQLPKSLKNESLYLKVMNSHLGFMKDNLADIKDQGLMISVILNFMYSAAGDLSKQPEMRGKRNLNVKFTGEQQTETGDDYKVKDDDINNTNDQVNKTHQSIVCNDPLNVTRDSRVRIKKNLRKIFEEYCKLQLVRTCIKTTFSDYVETISSLKITDFLLFCRDYDIKLKEDEKTNKAELITLYKLLCTSYGLGFKSFKNIIEHIAIRNVNIDDKANKLPEDERLGIFYSYLHAKEFDDISNTTNRQTKMPGFESTLERSNVIELKDKRQQILQQRESVYQSENRKTLERKLLKRSKDKSSSTRHLLQNHRKENMRSLRQLTTKSKDMKSNRSKSKSSKPYRPKYKNINSYYERNQLLKQREFIKNVEWKEITKLKKEELPEFLTHKSRFITPIE